MNYTNDRPTRGPRTGCMTDKLVEIGMTEKRL